MKRFLAFAVIFSLLSAIVMGVLWQKEKNNYNNIMLIFNNGVSNSLTSFTDFKTSGDESDYIQGVANFNMLVKSATVLPNTTVQNKNLTWLNSVYGSMIFKPEKTKENLELVINLLTALSNNPNDYSSYAGLDNLKNILEN